MPVIVDLLFQIFIPLLSPRRACYGVLRFIMESGARGCEIVVSGKLRGQRAKSMKFVDGLMIHSGHPAMEYVDTAVRHVMLRQGKLPRSHHCVSLGPPNRVASINVRTCLSSGNETLPVVPQRYRYLS